MLWHGSGKEEYCTAAHTTGELRLQYKVSATVEISLKSHASDDNSEFTIQETILNFFSKIEIFGIEKTVGKLKILFEVP
jgi:hypothetical protein